MCASQYVIHNNQVYHYDIEIDMKNWGQFFLAKINFFVDENLREKKIWWKLDENKFWF